MLEILDKFNNSIKKLPALTQAANKLVQLSSASDLREEIDLMEVVKLVELDPVLTLAVFKVVNAPAYGLMSKVTSVRQAVPLLGYKNIAAIAIASCAQEIYNSTLDGYESVSGMLWKSSFKAALIARELAPLARKPLDKGTAFTGGIFHDIGKAVISEFLRGHSPEIISALLFGEGPDFLNAETTVAGNNHCEVGASLADYWSLPEPIKQVILHHHAPERAEPIYRALVYAVHIGDALSMMLGSGTGLDSMQYTIDPGYARYFDINELQLYQAIMIASGEYDKMESSLFN